MNSTHLILGSGPGGYVAALRLAQLGFKPLVVEASPQFGGCCLNVGCIPSKALLASSRLYHTLSKQLKQHGIQAQGVTLDFAQVMKRKQEVVERGSKGIAYLFDKNGVASLQGRGRFVSPQEVEVEGPEGKQVIRFEKAIIATGSRPAALPLAPFDHRQILDSTDLLSLESIPESLAVIGGGVIGLELGAVYARFGTRVDVIEAEASILPQMDSSLGPELMRVLKKEGMKFHVGTKVEKITCHPDQVEIQAQGAKPVNLKVQACLVAIGRRPQVEDLGLEQAGVQLTQRGFIQVDEALQTTAANIFAIGDVTPGPMLAHKASEEGYVLAELLAGKKAKLDHRLIPGVVYTHPEVASVGYRKQDLEALGLDYAQGSFPLRPLGMAQASGDLDGFSTLYSDKATGKILGMHLVGAHAGELIATGMTSLAAGFKASFLSSLPFAHPSFSEAIKEAALAAAEGRALHN